MASTSATCTPQTGSRTRRRPVLVSCDGTLPPALCGVRCDAGIALRSIHPTKRRSSAMLQERMSSQKRKRAIRAIKVIGNWHSVKTPPSTSEASVCKGKRESQTKRREFNKLRDESDPSFLGKIGQIL